MPEKYLNTFLITASDFGARPLNRPDINFKLNKLNSWFGGREREREGERERAMFQKFRLCSTKRLELLYRGRPAALELRPISIIVRVILFIPH